MTIDDRIKYQGYDRTYSYEEIAIELGISVEKVRKIESLALRKLMYSHGRFIRELLKDK